MFLAQPVSYGALTSPRQVLLFLLIRDYSFEPLDGPQSKVNVVRDMASVPRVSGGDGVRVPLRVRRLDRTPLSASL